MKKTLSLILALIMLLSALPLTGISSFAYTSGDWDYNVSNGKAMITYYSGKASNVTIPSTLGGYPVEGIEYLAASYRDNIKTIHIPAGIKIINEAFNDFNGLESITVDASNSFFSSKDGVLFDKSKTKLIAYPNSKAGTEYTVPTGVTTICHRVFSQDYWYGKRYLEKVNLPSTLKVIEEGAFSGGEGFLDENLVLPNGMTTIGYGAFLNAGLKSITIPSSVKSIGDLAVGYDWIRQQGEELIKGFVIYGVPGSAAEKYAKDNKITFCKIGEFPDVPSSAWYYEAVKYVGEKGYMSGYQSGWFGPADKLKRQDFVVVLSKIAKADLSKYQNTASKLKDVKQGAYYAAAVNWAVDNGIISGYQNGRFGVGDNITREQVATILYRYMGSPTVSGADKTLAKFKDYKNISPFAKTAVAWAVQNGIISGMADGRVAPVEGASRAQIAVIIMNMDKKGLLGEVDVFKFFAGEYILAYHTGARSTTIEIQPDGSFTGVFGAQQVGGLEYGYYATLYSSEFSGKFKNPKKVNHYTYSFEVEKITYNQTPGTEEIKLYPGTDQNVRYVYTEAEGLDGTGIIYAYTSAAPLSKLPTEFKDFLFINNNSGALSFRGLYSFDSEYHYGWRENS